MRSIPSNFPECLYQWQRLLLKPQMSIIPTMAGWYLSTIRKKGWGMGFTRRGQSFSLVLRGSQILLNSVHPVSERLPVKIHHSYEILEIMKWDNRCVKVHGSCKDIRIVAYSNCTKHQIHMNTVFGLRI